MMKSKFLKVFVLFFFVLVTGMFMTKEVKATTPQNWNHCDWLATQRGTGNKDVTIEYYVYIEAPDQSDLTSTNTDAEINWGGGTQTVPMSNTIQVGQYEGVNRQAISSTHTYSSPGTYTIKYKAWRTWTTPGQFTSETDRYYQGASPCDLEATVIVTSVTPPPTTQCKITSFIASPTSVTSGGSSNLSFSFKDEISGRTDVAFDWSIKETAPTDTGTVLSQGKDSNKSNISTGNLTTMHSYRLTCGPATADKTIPVAAAAAEYRCSGGGGCMQVYDGSGTSANSWCDNTCGSANTAPTATTQAVSSIAQTTATGNGNVTADGGATITERGTVISTSANPTTADTKDTASGTTGAFTTSITGLTANTTYYVKAYAINSVGTSYGSQVNFTTLVTPPTLLPDLTAGAVTMTPSTAAINTPVNFSSTITNIGTASTGRSFNNFFQVATATNGGGTVTPLSSVSMSALAVNGSDTTTQSYTIPSVGYSVRACADLPPYNNGDVPESDEGNNCGPWTNLSAVQNGGWSAWSAQETRCGYTGEQTRTCTNPSPSPAPYAGADCSGLDGGNATKTYTTVACPTATLSCTSCTISNGASTCSSLVSWTTQNLTTGTTNISRNNPFNTMVVSPVPGNVFPTGPVSSIVNYGPSSFFFYHNLYGTPTDLASCNMNASCAANTIWNGKTCEGSGLTGVLTPSSSICNIGDGESACVANPINFSWSVSNPLAESVSSVTSNRSFNFPVASGNSGNKDFAVHYGTETLYLYNNYSDRPLAQTTVAGVCESGAGWDLGSGKCKTTPPENCGNGVFEPALGEQCDAGIYNGLCPSTCSSACTVRSCVSVGDIRINVNPNIIFTNGSAKLTWSWDGAASCTGTNFDDAGQIDSLVVGNKPIASSSPAGGVTVKNIGTNAIRFTITCGSETAYTVLTSKKIPTFKEI